MVDELCIELAGETVHLHADRAVHWPRMSTLVIADLHLGKADHFRRAGIALPRGGTSHDLERLDALLQRTHATRLLVLGDLVHGALGDAPWLRRWSAWRRGWPQLRVEVVPGNHDRQLMRAPAQPNALDVTVHGAFHSESPFVFIHGHARESASAEGAGYVLSGHLHPVIRLPGLPRLPAFHFGPNAGVLPAFTAFSGGSPISAASPGRSFVCAPESLVEIGRD